jgi:hypothetical protein
MSEDQAAAYVSLSPNTLRANGPQAKRIGRRVLWDRHDLDRWADRIGGQPLDARAQQEEAGEVERRFMEQRRA